MVSIYYHSGWTRPALHYNPGEGWHDSSLTRTHRYFWHKIELTYCPVRFVFTDGDGHWDNPAAHCRSTVGRNYYVTEPGRYAVFKGNLVKIRESTVRLMLITDLDGTLLEMNNPEADAASERFAWYWLERHYFNDSKLVYSSGRSLEQFLELRKTKIVLLDPDVLIANVGSDAYVMRSDSGEYEGRDDYIEMFKAQHWDTAIISQILNSRFPWLIQPSSQMDFRFKTWRTARVEDLADHERALKAFVKDSRNFPADEKQIHCRVHISGIGSHRYLDFAPTNGAKRAGVDYCKNLFSFRSEEILVAGDSGNDFAMLKGPERSVIPSNRQPDMDTWFHKKYRGQHKYISQLAYADAIIEALTRMEAQ